MDTGHPWRYMMRTEHNCTSRLNPGLLKNGFSSHNGALPHRRECEWIVGASFDCELKVIVRRMPSTFTTLLPIAQTQTARVTASCEIEPTVTVTIAVTPICANPATRCLRCAESMFAPDVAKRRDH